MRVNRSAQILPTRCSARRSIFPRSSCCALPWTAPWTPCLPLSLSAGCGDRRLSKAAVFTRLDRRRHRLGASRPISRGRWQCVGSITNLLRMPRSRRRCIMDNPLDKRGLAALGHLRRRGGGGPRTASASSSHDPPTRARPRSPPMPVATQHAGSRRSLARLSRRARDTKPYFTLNLRHVVAAPARIAVFAIVARTR